MKASEKRKTFNVKLNKPFGHESQDLSFKIHAETFEDATFWVTQIFPGAISKIEDCDKVKNLNVSDGVKIFIVQIPDENHRITKNQALDELLSIYWKLLDEIGRFRQAKNSYKEKSSNEVSHFFRYESLESAKQNLEKSKIWAHRLLGEIVKLQKSI